MWGLSERTVRRMLADQAGILRLGQEATSRRRRYLTLRVPESVLTRIYERLAPSATAKV
jgi:hypothetical protein